jgi:hypothetical protein
MVLVVRCLGEERRDWAAAMLGEYETAVEDARPLSFALGCLAAAVREMPRHRQGRVALVGNGVALGLIVPAAALCVWSALLGFPFLAFGDVGMRGFLAGASRQLPLLNGGDWALAPPLTMLVLLLAAGQMLLAWFVLERNWDRASAAHRFNAAVMTTLVALGALLAFDMTIMAPLLVGLVTEVLAVQALAWWHDGLPTGAAKPDG